MIESFGDKMTEDFYRGSASAAARRIPAAIRKTALIRLDAIEFAIRLDDLRVPPGNRLEALRGDLAGFHSIRINSQWRIVFRWERDRAYDVRVMDHHAQETVMLPTKRITTHPGELLLELFLKPAGVPQRAFAAHLGITPTRLNEIIRGKRSVTAETAWLLSQALDTSPEFWLNAQTAYDLTTTRNSVRKVKRFKLEAA